MERVWGSICDKSDVDGWYSASNAIGKEWHIHGWLELKINLFFSLFIFNDSCCYVHCCVASLSIFMTSLLHTHSFSAVKRIVSFDTEGIETESGIFFFSQFCVSVHHIMINKNTSLMQLISIYFTYSKSLHFSGRTLPIIRRIWYCTYQWVVLVR